MAKTVSARYVIDHEDGQGHVMMTGFLGHQMFNWDDALDVTGNLRKAAQRYIDTSDYPYRLGKESPLSSGCGLRFVLEEKYASN